VNTLQVLHLPCFGIVLSLFPNGSGTIRSEILKEEEVEQIGREDGVNATALCAAVDAIESLILAHACAGIDISVPAYIEGIETAVQKLFNEYT